MRPLARALLTLSLAALWPAAAHASHWTIRGAIEGESAPYRYNLENCTENKEYRFVWVASQIQVPIRINNDYRYEIRISTDDSSTCDYNSTSDNCEAVVPATRWDMGSTTFSQSIALSRFFEDGCTGAGQRRAVLFLYDALPLIPGGTVEPAMRGEIVFDYDFSPPAAPQPPTVNTGDQGLNVSWFSGGADAGSVRSFRVYWSTDASKLTGSPVCPSGASYRTSCAYAGPFTGGQARIGGLQNGETVYVAIAEIDDFKNVGPVSTPVPGVPQQISDFFRFYADSGGGEKGGFCFIATAAYGSSLHPLVGSLRRFRDSVLLRSELGRDLVSFYYGWSPALAEVLADTPHLRVIFRVLLAPVAVAAWFVVDLAWWEKLLFVLALWLALRYARAFFRRMARDWRPGFGAFALATLAFGAVAFDGGTARADTESPRNFMLELKVGGISPDMDRRAGPVGTIAPYQKIFGDGMKTVGGFELEYQLIKDKGTLGISGAMSFFQAVGRGVLSSSGQMSPETTVMNVMPFQVNAVYRFDIPLRKYGVPFVPYAKAGFDWYLWWVLNGAGAVSTFTDQKGEKRRGLGGTFGIHGTLGLQFSLDILDRRMQKALDDEIGVNGSYLFAEVVFSRVDDFSQAGFNFSSIYFYAGLALEF